MGTPAQACDVAVLGAGWAGLAAAVELVESGHRVLLLEAAPAAGGRARGVHLRLGEQPAWLDNGQHLLMGAYRETLALAHKVASSSPQADSRTPRITRKRLRLTSVDGLALEAASLPAPLHLLVALARAHGLTARERVAMTTMLLRLQMARWQVRRGETVAALLKRFRQPDNLCRRIWEPLALGALNTAPEQACAATFACVLRDTLGGDARASDFVLPDRTLSELLPSPAVDWLRARGAAIAFRAPVRQLTPSHRGWMLRTDAQSYEARAVVLALPCATTARLLRPIARSDAARATVDALERLVPAPIATVYLAWPAASVPGLPEWILLDARPQDGAPGQWLFDRGILNGLRIAAVVVSAVSEHAGRETLCAQVAEQIARQLGLPPPLHSNAIVEKRATFLCTPDRPRLMPDTLASGCAHTDASWSRLMLAGDYAWPDYPATLEAAVRSGRAAARALHKLPDA